MKSKGEMVAYIPVIHKGYMEMFKEFGGQVNGLWVLGEGLIGQLAKHPPEIRSVDAQTIAIMARSLSMFDKVEVLEETNLGDLFGKQLVMPDEEVSRELAKSYFSEQPVDWVTVFLRWNEANVSSPLQVRPDRVSVDPKDKEIMKLACGEAANSSDWWRHTGAAVVKDQQVLLIAHNRHAPSEQTQYINGDPRDVVQAGTQPDLYTSIHAEQMLVAKAAEAGLSLQDTAVYINVFPCPTCTRLLAFSGVKQCYYQSGSAWLKSDEVMRAMGIEIIRVDG